MNRPDQEKFDEFAAPLVKFNKIWQKYSEKYGFSLEKNPYRKPGFILRKYIKIQRIMIVYIIEMYLEPFWFDIAYTDDLPYTFGVCALCDDSTNNSIRWKLAVDIAKNIPLPQIEENMIAYFNQAIRLLSDWTPDHIVQHGTKTYKFDQFKTGP